MATVSVLVWVCASPFEVWTVGVMARSSEVRDGSDGAAVDGFERRVTAAVAVAGVVALVVSVGAFASETTGFGVASGVVAVLTLAAAGFLWQRTVGLVSVLLVVWTFGWVVAAHPGMWPL